MVHVSRIPYVHPYSVCVGIVSGGCSVMSVSATNIDFKQELSFSGDEAHIRVVDLRKGVLTATGQSTSQSNPNTNTGSHKEVFIEKLEL